MGKAYESDVQGQIKPFRNKQGTSPGGKLSHSWESLRMYGWSIDQAWCSNVRIHSTSNVIHLQIVTGFRSMPPPCTHPPTVSLICSRDLFYMCFERRQDKGEVTSPSGWNDLLNVFFCPPRSALQLSANCWRKHLNSDNRITRSHLFCLSLSSDTMFIAI